MLDGASHVLEVGSGSVLDVLTLPVGEGIGENNVDATLHDSVTSTIGPLVPGVGGADLGTLRQDGANVIDLVEQLVASEVAAVQRLGTDGDGVDLVSILVGRVGLEGLLVGLERLVDVGPIGGRGLASASWVHIKNNLMRHA